MLPKNLPIPCYGLNRAIDPSRSTGSDTPFIGTYVDRIQATTTAASA